MILQVMLSKTADCTARVESNDRNYESGVKR